MSLTIGQRLRKAREYRLLTLEKASEATHIRVNYLQALETDDYSIISSAAQGRGFLRNYAEFLDLDLDAILAELQKDPPPVAEISGPLPHVDAIPEAPEEEMTSRPFWTRYLPRKPKAESAPEDVSPEPQEQPAPVEVTPPVVEEKPVKPRGRRKKAAEIKEQVQEPAVEEVKAEAEIMPVEVEPEAEMTPVEAEQVEAPNEAQTEEPKPSLFARVKSLLRVRMPPARPQPEEEAVEEETEVEAPPVKSTETPEEIFISIGAELRKQRELISLTFDEVERHTKVRAQFLKEMEAGAFDKLPSPVQTRGMLTNYATFLDLDVDVILLRFADALQARHRQKYPDKLRTKDLMDVAPSMPPLRSFIAGDLIFGLGMIAVLVALAIWGVGRVMNSQDPQESVLPTAPSISDVLAGSPQPTVIQEVTFVPVAGGTQFSSITEEATVTVEPLDVNVQVIVTAVERAFVRISVDGEEVFNGRVLPGDTFTYEAELQVSILTGNGAALLIKYNGRDLGLMGDFGQVVSQVYSAGGLVTATPTASPTATETPLVTTTPTLTETPTPTVAQTPTP